MDIIKTRYSTENKYRRYVKGYGFLFFMKNIGKNIDKNISSKYSQKLIDSTQTSAADAIETASKRTTQKTAEATGDLVGNKIVDKITSYSKKSPDPSTELNSNETNNKMPKERYISPQERQKIIDELRLI